MSTRNAKRQPRARRVKSPHTAESKPSTAQQIADCWSVIKLLSAAKPSERPVRVCEIALAQMRMTLMLLEENFGPDSTNPVGWCPVEATRLLEEAILMLEPLTPEEEEGLPPVAH